MVGRKVWRGWSRRGEAGGEVTRGGGGTGGVERRQLRRDAIVSDPSTARGAAPILYVWSGQVAAGVFDAEMTGGLGINIRRVFTAVFAFGAALGGLSGVIAGPIQSAYPSMGVAILIPALIVVVVGGLGSLKGSLVGSLVIGQAETFGKAWLPDAAMLIIYVVMATVMLVRPQGLFGRPLK